MSMRSRFILYMKAASNGRDIGDCPFSQRALMFAKLKVPSDKIDIKTVDLANKSEEFINLKTDGKVPVLVDRGQDDNEQVNIIADSAEITKYLDREYPELDCHCGYSGQALDVCSNVFPKLAALLKNKDKSQTESLKTDLMKSLEKVNEYLESDAHKGKFLITDEINEIDCMFLPRLRHVIVAAGHYAGFKIPDDMTGLQKYIAEGNNSDIFKSTCCPEEEIVKGWSKHVN